MRTHGSHLLWQLAASIIKSTIIDRCFEKNIRTPADNVSTTIDAKILIDGYR
jgi:hypothetical protein